MIILKTRSEVTAKVTQKWYETLGHCKKHPHINFEIPTPKNIEVMPILETRSEVKVTVMGKWNRTIRHSKMHLHSKFGIPTSDNKRYAPDIIILKTRSEVKFKVTVTCKRYMTRHHPKMHPHTKFGIPISNNIRDMFWTQLFYKLGQSDPKMVCDTPPSKDASTHQIWDSYLQ